MNCKITCHVSCCAHATSSSRTQCSQIGTLGAQCTSKCTMRMLPLPHSPARRYDTASIKPDGAKNSPDLLYIHSRNHRHCSFSAARIKHAERPIPPGTGMASLAAAAASCVAARREGAFLPGMCSPPAGQDV
ncbi:hypothetical protein E2C01_082901 [Portunus trituberculatus]|uniref:Uncharacterized protein n=1 Tax=Portunus trituberculatus TaxID=210409 RepID=A0A5B7IVR8_PORTR|nr:hypothetical protein [Portunus trituberculatus]